MKSMTGYGRACRAIDGFNVTLEAASVNKRGFEVYINLPREWQLLERDLLQVVRDRILRGKVNLYFNVSPVGASAAMGWSEAATANAVAELEKLAAACRVAFVLDLNVLYKLATSVGQQQSLPDVDAVKVDCQEMVAESLEQLDQMRRQEGGHLLKDLSQRLGNLLELTEKVAIHSAKTVVNYRDMLMARLKALGLELNLDDERLLKELSIFADRCDNSEELTRLKSHIAQFGEMLSADKAVGRPLDFLCQELNREINTLGSKANNADITKLVLEMKNQLERMREQIQNIE